ncbi:MAG: ribosomal RNA small subunit methyltransferase A [Candidatus Pacebacteria bacterium]|nr:ribosomal RNA small subunit methyltransferase A [Candidatus Paceibacterota bacterium]
MQYHKAKKSLGQNFLKSDKILGDIVDAGEINKKDTVLEIGPGKGALTEKILEKAGLVIAIEKDRNLYEILKDKFKEQIQNKKLVLIEADILDLNPKLVGLKSNKYKIIANIPYNITGAILRKFLTEETHPNTMVLMLQHEVVKRILARDAKESILSISVKAYGLPKMVMKVGARYFSPAPKVDSAVISIKDISKKIFKDSKVGENDFWDLIHKGFSHKRKKLSNNLKNYNNIDKTVFLRFKDKRAEDLSLDDWLSLLK